MFTRLLSSLFALSLSGCVIVGTEDDATANMRKQLIQRAVRDRASEVKNCYDYELKKDPKLPKTKITMEWEVDSDGHTKNITATTTEPAGTPETTFNKCLVDVWHEMAFPPPAKGAELKIKYPLVFTPENPT